jgi:hypothetical protein
LTKRHFEEFLSTAENKCPVLKEGCRLPRQPLGEHISSFRSYATENASVDHKLGYTNELLHWVSTASQLISQSHLSHNVKAIDAADTIIASKAAQSKPSNISRRW